MFRVEISGGVVRYRRNGALLRTSTKTPRYPLLVDASLWNTGANISNVVLSGDLVASGLVTSTVSWVNGVGVTATPGNLTKTTPSAWDAGALSLQSLIAGDGYVQFLADEANTWRMVGLGNGDANQSYTDLEFAIEVGATGIVTVWESGVNRGNVSTYVSGDVFRVAIEDGIVRYKKNGAVIHTSALSPTYPLYVDTSLFSSGATVKNVVLSGVLAESVLWRNIYGASAAVGRLTKVLPSGAWTAGAVSTKWVASEEGFVEATATQVNTSRLIGFGSGDVDQGRDDVEFGIELTSSGAAVIRESGVSRATFSYSPGDRFRVSVEGGIIHYRRNRALLYTSALTPTYPLLVDTSLFDFGALLSDVALAGTLADVTLSPPPPPPNQAPIVNAGPDTPADLAGSLNLTGTVTDDGQPIPPNAVSVTWTKTSGPGTVTFGTPNSLTTTATFSAPGAYVLRLTASDSALTSYDELAVNVSSSALLVVGNTTLSAGDAVFKARLEALGYPVSVKLASAAVAGDATGKAIVVISTTSPNGDVLDKFRTVAVPVMTMSNGIFDDMGLTDAAGRGGTTTNQATINLPTHPMAAGLLGTLQVHTGIVGYNWGTPNGNGVKVVTVPGNSNQALSFGYLQGAAMYGLTAPARRVGLGFTSPSMPDLTVAGRKIFDAAVRWATAVNASPWADAGPDLTVGVTGSATLQGRVFDDGLPNPPATVTANWVKVSGPGSVAFGNPSVAATTATFSAVGDYVLRLTASDSVLTHTDLMVVNVTANPPPNSPPSVSAGVDQTIAYPSPAYLQAIVTDDGFPTPPGSIAVTWTKAEGPGSATFTAPNSTASSVTFSSPGIYVLRLTAADGAASTSSDVRVTVGPVADTLLVVGDALNLAPVDVVLKQRMDALGLRVQVKNAAASTSTDANGKVLVFVSSSSLNGDVLMKFRSVATPVVIMHEGLYDDMSLTDSASRGGVVASQLTIGSPTHPLAAGLSGTVAISQGTATQSLLYGTPSGSATTVGHVPAAPAQGVVFAYETAASMVGLTAPARRMAFGIGDLPNLTSQGISLLDASLKWMTERRAVLLVVGSTTLTASDTAIKNRLDSLGLSSMIVTSAATSSADAVGKALVVIAPSVIPAQVGTKFRDSAIPALVAHSSVFPLMNLTGGTLGTHYGTTVSQLQIQILAPSHPLAARLTGTPMVTSSWETYGWGVPAATAINVAGLVSDAAKSTIFGYDNWAQMVGSSVSERRVGFFAGPSTGTLFTIEAWQLFDAAVRWGLAGDADGDGLDFYGEWKFGTDPLNKDTNGDGILDGAAARSGISSTNNDVDGDGITNAAELTGGTDAFRADSDGDGANDNADCFPLDPTRSACPPPVPGDCGAPRITLNEPTNAVLISTLPPNQAPVARPGGPYSAGPAQVITFDGSTSSDCDGAIVGYSWTFGDGATGSGPNPTHAYSAAGTYTVGLTVTDDEGGTGPANTTAYIVSGPPIENVVWRNAVGVSISGNSITKTAVTAWGNAGAVSTRAIASGDGSVAFTVGEAGTIWMAGLGVGDTDQNYPDIAFAFYPSGSGGLYVRESGISRGQVGTYVAGDRLQISVESGVVRYRANGVLVYTSTVTPTYPLLLDTSPHSMGATIQSATISGSLVDAPLLPQEDVVWTNAIGVSVSTNTLTKTAATAWGNAGAVSTRAITSGDGFVAFTVGEASTIWMAGLGVGNTDQSYQDIEFAFYPSAGALYVRESGVSRGQVGAYAAGDRLQISVESGVVRYRANGVLVYTSTVTPTYPLLLDTSPYSTGATIQNAKISGTLQ